MSLITHYLITTLLQYVVVNVVEVLGGSMLLQTAVTYIFQNKHEKYHICFCLLHKFYFKNILKLKLNHNLYNIVNYKLQNNTVELYQYIQRSKAYTKPAFKSFENFIARKYSEFVIDFSGLIGTIKDMSP